jgi:hypothetical protein
MTDPVVPQTMVNEAEDELKPSAASAASLASEVPVTRDPRQTTTRVVRKRRPNDHGPGFFAWPAASSLTFLLSAACLLGGAWTVFSSLIMDQDMLGERFGMVAAVHVYELALVLVAVVLCRFQRANPDAIGPVLLGASFLVGSAVTLDLVSIDAPYMTLMCGLTGMALALAKGRVLARLGGGASTLMMLVPLAFFMTWNLLWPAVMGLYLNYSVSGLASAAWWISGWAVALLATSALVIGIVRDDAVGIDRQRPFLRRSALRWTLALVIAACSALHLEVLGYVHSLDVTLGDFLPLIALLCLGAVDLRHRAYGPAAQLDHCILSAPLALALLAVVREEHGLLSNPYDAGTVFAPAMVLAVYAGLVWRLGAHRQQYAWRIISVAALVATALMWQAAPRMSGLNWFAAGLMTLVILVLHALITRRPTILAGALVISVSLGLLHPESMSWQQAHGLAPAASVLAADGIVLLTVALLWPRAFTNAVIRGALLMVTIGMMHACGRQESWLHAPILSGLGLVMMHAIAAWRTRDVFALTPLLLPLLVLAPTWIPEHKGWLAVWMSFALLGAGVALSWARVRTAQARRLTKGAETSLTPLTPLTPLAPVMSASSQSALE